jgi:hypothetical protein
MHVHGQVAGWVHVDIIPLDVVAELELELRVGGLQQQPFAHIELAMQIMPSDKPGLQWPAPSHIPPVQEVVGGAFWYWQMLATQLPGSVWQVGGDVHAPPQGWQFPWPSQLPPEHIVPGGWAVYLHCMVEVLHAPGIRKQPFGGVVQGSPPQGRQAPAIVHRPLGQGAPAALSG